MDINDIFNSLNIISDIDLHYPNHKSFSELFKNIISQSLNNIFTYDLTYYKTHLHNEPSSIPKELTSLYDKYIMLYYNSLYQIFLKHFQINSHIDSCEVEFRIGTIIDKRFNTDVSKIHFETMLNGFLNNNDFIKKYGMINYSDTTDFFTDFQNSNIRITLDNITNKITKIIQKNKIDIYDFECKGCPFDLRLSYSNEKTVDNFYNFYKQPYFNGTFKNFRRKERISISFMEKLYVFDFTIVNSYINFIPTTEYEIELEINLQKLMSFIKNSKNIDTNLMNNYSNNSKKIESFNDFKTESIKGFILIFELFSLFEKIKN
jgi:hypothetical protein